MIRFFGILLLITLFISACTDDSSSSGEHESLGNVVIDSLHTGMIRILATGNGVDLGTDDETVPLKDRPKMRVDLSYDYSISEHEVTCEEFKSLMDIDVKCPKGDLPKTLVSYYDAVLYANARSKDEKLDTAYQYSGAIFDSEGSCILLESLVFDASKESYRLPTEAEWVYAAAAGWNPQKSWNASNSNFETHAVCLQPKNSFGLCDMAGNVMELVNDWLGYLRDTTVTNFAGAMDGGALSERILKGGSYRSELPNVNLFSRGDVYTVSSANKTDYVGFRLAFGSIPNAVWLDFNGMANSSRLQTVFSGSEMKRLMHTHKVKLAFRNDATRNLAFVDYAQWGSSVFEIVDTMDVYHPEISPDGKWVAFCTKPEGTAGKSSLYIRKLELYTQAVKLDVESAAIPRWVVRDGDTLITYVDNAGGNKDESTWSSYGTWAVRVKNGTFGTPQKILEGSFNGGVFKDYSMAVTGAQLLRVRQKDDASNTSYRDSVWYNGEQACNVSLSKDESKQVLFLDFGGKTGEEFVGSKYGVHERILLMDSTGRLTGSVKAPPGKSFDHTEWSNSNFVVATLTNVNGSHGEIALVNLQNSSVSVLVRGDELWHPSLWIDKVFVLDSTKSMLDPDSAGAYCAAGFSDDAKITRQKMELFWNNLDTMNTVILGSSRPAAVDPLEFGNDIYAINMTLIPHILYESKFLMENYLIPHAKKLKNVVVSVDIDLWYLSEREPINNFFASEANYIAGYVYDVNHNFWKNESLKGMSEYVSHSYNEERARERYAFHRGMVYVPPYDIWWEDEPAVDYDSTWLDHRAEDYQNNLENLKSIIELAAEENMNVVGVIFPQSPGFKKTGSFGRYGIRRSQADSLIQEIADLSKTYKNFKLLDENKMGNHDYPDSLALNRDHLINLAAGMITSRIDSVLHSF